MALPIFRKKKSNTSLPNLELEDKKSKKSKKNNDDGLSEEIRLLRTTMRWKNAYARMLPNKPIYKTDERYNAFIDKLVSTPPTVQTNLVGSWNTFKPKDYDINYLENKELYENNIKELNRKREQEWENAVNNFSEEEYDKLIESGQLNKILDNQEK